MSAHTTLAMHRPGLAPRPAIPALHRRWLAAGLASAALLVSVQAQGNTTPAPPTTAPHQASTATNALLAAFGHREGLARLTTVVVDRAKADARIGHFFKDVSAKHLSQQLADQFCALLSGPCVYDGETMKKSHQDLNIARKDFLALVELLQQAMDEQGIAFSAQNRLLALLAPMHREVVAR